ncbi:MAG: protein-tyrosine-phosphatase [Bacteroidota bacterium]
MMYPKLQQFIEGLQEEVSNIPEDRKPKLEQIVSYLKAQQEKGNTCHLTFICTHNSRRSHMGQIWARTMAHLKGMEDIQTWSGGTEATAFNPHAIKAIQEAGFEVVMEKEGDNPHYRVTYGEGDTGSEAFSKVFSHGSNPQSNFGAVMTCQEADEACPFVPGAAMRVALSYDDPKAFDGTELQDAKYMERSRQIAAEMWWVFDKASK